jgi:hypothetical protein
MVIVIAAVIIQCYIFIVMIIRGIIVIIITTARLVEFGIEDLAEGKQCCNTNNNINKPQACERTHKADSCP